MNTITREALKAAPEGGAPITLLEALPENWQAAGFALER